MLSLANSLQALSRSVRRGRSVLVCALTMTLIKDLSIEKQEEIDRILSGEDIGSYTNGVDCNNVESPNGFDKSSMNGITPTTTSQVHSTVGN